jgi:hypothetical protein
MVPATIEAEWPRIGPLLAPAIAVDPARQEADVYRDLLSGDMALYDMDLQGAQGVVVVEINSDGVNSKTFWILYVAGRISGPRSHWLGRVKTLTSYFVGIARAMNCTELRIEGRNWGRVFPEWERIGDPNQLRLVL